MQAIPCALADIARSPAALDALRIIVDRVHVVKTAVYLLCTQWLTEKKLTPETENELVQLFKNAFYVLNAPSKIHSEQQKELKALCVVTMSTNGLSSKWVKQEARTFALTAATMETGKINAEPTVMLINKELTLSTEDLILLLPDRIFSDMKTSRREIVDFLKRFAKPKPKKIKLRVKLAEARKIYQDAHNLIWNLVFDFYVHPFNTGKEFQSNIKTDGENCFLVFKKKNKLCS